jgi:CheY-like chemotaxis protein
MKEFLKYNSVPIAGTLKNVSVIAKELRASEVRYRRPETQHKNLKLTFSSFLPDKEAIIKTDKEKVDAILTNLIKNAIKFTSEGSIEVGYERKGNYLEFFVKDSGIGVLPEQNEIIFERFRQGSESLIRNYEGAGLGLSISKGYTEILGGKIRVESNVDVFGEKNGSIFYFTISYNPDNENFGDSKNIIPISEKDNQVKNLKILIVEDDVISDLLISILIKRISNNILKAGSGDEAIETCRKNPDINLILMDIKMPVIDGYEATRQIRKFNKKVVIIAQTAYSLPGDREKALEAGCNEYISKPINLSVLNNLIKKLFT